MRRIIIFSLVYYPRFVGGAEVAIKEITNRISPEEVEFDMVTLRLDSNLPKFERIGNVNVYRVGWTGKYHKENSGLNPGNLPWHLHLNKYAMLWTAFIKAVSLNRIRKYDAIWSFMATYNSFAALFFRLAHPEIPFILTLQDGDPISHIKHRAMPLYPLFRMIFTRADHIQAISRYLADWARSMGAKCPVSVVPNGVDLGLFSKEVPTDRLEALKGRLGKRDGDIFLITTSRLVVKNAVGDIIDALQYLPRNVKLVILGQGILERELKAKSARLYEERVKFLGNIPHDELPEYLQASDIFIRPSLSEGFGISFVEAMAVGIPVIATPVGGIVDFLRDGETGLFCETKNPKSIAQKVEKLLKDRESKEYIVRKAREMVREKYGWNDIASEMKKVLDAGVS